MNFSAWSIRHPVPPIALFLVLIVIGLVSFQRLPVTEFPNTDMAVISVSINLPGAAPAEITSQIVEPLESELRDLSGVRHVSATASDGAASLSITFEVGTSSDSALNDVQNAVAAARGDLPEGITEPLVQKFDATGAPILTYAVSDPTRSVEELSAFIEDVVARDLEAAGGVGDVVRLGGAEREIGVELHPDRLLALGLTAAEVSSQLARVNLNQGGGSGDLAGQDYSIRALGSAQSVATLEDTPIRLPTGDTVRLAQLGSVRDGATEAEAFALLDGQPVVAFSVFRATGASDLSAGENAKARLEAIEAQYPDTEITLIKDATISTEANYVAAMNTLYEGAALAIVVVFLFLRSWRATVVACVALPLSVIPTFIVMDALGFSLNTVSLLGITLVVGILVDDAIVEIENIVRHIHMGRTPYDAAMEAADEIGTTVIAISLTIVAVFAPVGFMAGFAGQIFRQFGLTVAVAVLFSLLVARIITPMFAAYFMKSNAVAEEEKDGWLMRTYLRVLAWTLRHRAVTLIAGAIIFAASIYSATLLPTEFLPAEDTGRATVSIELPPGSTLEQAKLVGDEATQLLWDIPEVESVFVDGSSATQIAVEVSYGDREHRERGWEAINADIEARLADIPDVRLLVLAEGGARDISLNILGDTEAAASAAALELAQQMKGLAQLRSVSTEASLSRPEIQIIPRPEIAAELGVNATTLASTIRVATLGDNESSLAKLSIDDDQIPIRVRLEAAARNDLTRLIGLRVPTSTGAQIPLGAVADIRLDRGPSVISRYDQRYSVTVEADLAEGAALGTANEAIEDLPAITQMPEGTSLQPAGDVEFMNEIFSGFALAMGTGILLVYVVLVLLFGSFVTPVTILLSLPLAIGGAIFALYVYGAGIGLSVVIGFLMLMGIVTKNAIMLVEFALQAIDRGVDRTSAIIDAGHKRARPIIMTTVAMTAGMVPTALAHGDGAEIRAPMAIAVIGGLLISTLLSLLFVPSLFSVMEGLKNRLRAVLAWALGNHRSHEHAKEQATK